MEHIVQVCDMSVWYELWANLFSDMEAHIPL